MFYSLSSRHNIHSIHSVEKRGVDRQGTIVSPVYRYLGVILLHSELAVVVSLGGGKSEIQLNLHPGQKRAWNSKRRFVAVIAGAQSG